MVKKEKEIKLSKKDIAYKYYTQKYGKHKIRVWKNKKAAKADALNLKQKGYKVKMSADGKAAIIIGKLTRGYERTATGRRAVKSQAKRRSTTPRQLPRKKPYTPEGYQTFRQPSLTLRKMGWES